MFDIETFVDACQRANQETEPRTAVADLLRQTVTAPSQVGEALQPALPGISVLYGSPELTILNVVWAPHMELPAHDHRMWAAIAIYGGQEDNTLYCRDPDDRAGLVESGGKVLCEGDVLVLGDDAIHGVENPLGRLTGAIHVYGGDFVNEPRSQWGPGEQRERPFDLDYIQSLFETNSSSE